MTSLYLALFAVISYFIGNINWAILISKFKKADIRTMGSGNPGTLNMSRNFGLKIGLLTFFLDILKGALPTLVAFFVFKNKTFSNSAFFISDFAIYLCGFSAVLGHIFPVTLKFKGGKGIASTIGVFIVTESVHGMGWASVAIMAIVAAALFIYFTEFGAMGSFIAITPPAISSLIRLYMDYGTVYLPEVRLYHILSNVLIFLICFFTWYAHKKNIKRMLAGEEHPTSIKEMVVKMKAKKLAQAEKNKENSEK